MNPITQSEDSLQIQVVDWCRLQRNRARHVIHIPNQGKRSVVQGARFKRMGMRPGVADLLLPFCNAAAIGFWLELKVGYREPTQAQVDFAAEMMDLGYAWGWANTFDQAIDAISAYSGERFHSINPAHKHVVFDPDFPGFFCTPKGESFATLRERVYAREARSKNAPHARQSKSPKNRLVSA